MEPSSAHLEASELTRQITAAYDELPYDSHSFENTHPIRLRSVALVHGLETAPADRCRVLELGCAQATNLLPLADTYPDSEFVGVDLSARHVEIANQRIEQLGSANLTVTQRDIADVDETMGGFDYIMCHGVYSWVPRDVQAHILRICHDLINPQGVSYVSYNSYPGWYLKEALRRLLFEHVSDVGRLRDRVRATRELMAELRNRIDVESPYGGLLVTYADSLLDSSDALIAHDYLAPVNEPLFFDQFVARLDDHDLRHLSDQAAASQFRTVSLDAEAAADAVRSEQVSDILDNATFRRAVVCRRDESVSEEFATGRLLDFQVASSLAPPADLDPGDHSEATFANRADTMTTTSPVLKTALDRLWQLWPASTAVRDLWDHVDARLADTSDVERGDKAERQLIEGLSKLRAHGTVDFFVEPFEFTSTLSERPCASASARLEAANGDITFTNRRHEALPIDGLMRFLIVRLDGSRTEAELIDAASDAVSAGSLSVSYLDGSPVPDRAEQARLLRWLVPKAVDTLASSALIVA